MRLQWWLIGGLFLVLFVVAWAAGTHSTAKLDTQPAAEFLFTQRNATSACAQHKPGAGYILFGGPRVSNGGSLPKIYTHLEELSLPVAKVPALTITADISEMVNVTGGTHDNWSLGFCAQDQEVQEEEAQPKLKQFSMTRVGDVISLRGPEFFNSNGSYGTLAVDAPADAPIVVHGSWAAVAVRDMSAPVRVTATHARASILNTTGNVDADGGVVDFGGSKGRVTLTASMEMNLKMTATHFDGVMNAWSGGPLRMLVPKGFGTAFQVMVERPKALICRADLCSQMKQQGSTFVYAGDGKSDSRQILLRSDQTFMIDNAQ